MGGFQYILLYAASFLVLVASEYNGVIFTKEKNAKEWHDHFCVFYNPHFHTLPLTQENTTVRKVVDISDKYGCTANEYTAEMKDAIVIVARTHCLFREKGRLAQTAGAKALIVASDDLLTPGANETSDYKEINITIGTALKKDIKEFVNNRSDLVAILYQPTINSKFDPNMVVIFLIAVTNIIIGGYWSGMTKYAKYKKLKYKHKKEQEPGTERTNGTDEEPTSDTEEETVDVSMIVILIFFVLVCAFLVLLYFFYDYLVYVVIALFCIAGAMGLFYCFSPLLHRIVPWKARLPRNKVPLFSHRPEYRDLVWLAACFGVSIFWGVERHASYAWIIQDILGYAFCINIMKTVGIPNIKICTVLLCLLFVYDIFFVFITPLFTKNGESVMVQVATGGSSKSQEKLPMVFQVPRLTQDPLSSCPLPYSLLGFGDIVVPGLLVAYNHYFDLMVNSKTKRIYYICSCIGYALGLIITFIALALMETGQPALLYLVPCTLLPTYVIGCIRGEVKLLWRGPGEAEESKTVDSGPATLDSVVSDSQATVNSTNTANSGSTSCSENESRGLLRK